eukprot:GHUV01004277.1.p3 GENE.GHUV01004277.1~~GHUV01004277.1.p3  ORF type:complete len:113 (-),score=14.97 GHUV01004277.1:176-514(-)
MQHIIRIAFEDSTWMFYMCSKHELSFPAAQSLHLSKLLQCARTSSHLGRHIYPRPDSDRSVLLHRSAFSHVASRPISWSCPKVFYRCAILLEKLAYSQQKLNSPGGKDIRAS